MEVVPGLHQVTGDKYVFHVKASQRKYVVGPAGSTVKELQERFGVRITNGRGDANPETILCKIIGHRDDVLHVFEEILRKKELFWKNR